MSSEHQERIQKTNTALGIIDKLLPQLPDFGAFNFAHYAKEVLNWNPTDIREIATHDHEVFHLMLNQFQYVNERTKGYYYELNDKGRAAKLAGGHYAYLEKLRVEKELTKRKEHVDLRTKEFIFKARFIPYIFSTLSIIGTIVSIFIAVKAVNYKKEQILTDQSIQVAPQLKKADTLLSDSTNIKAKRRQ